MPPTQIREVYSHLMEIYLTVSFATFSWVLWLNLALAVGKIA